MSKGRLQNGQKSHICRPVLDKGKILESVKIVSVFNISSQRLMMSMGVFEEIKTDYNKLVHLSQ